MQFTLTKDLTPLKEVADRAIRQQAEAQRMRFITPGAGKAMAYQQKAVEAEGFMQAGDNPDLSLFPHIVGEAHALGITNLQMAQLILQLRRQWQVASAAIEEVERVKLISLVNATSPAQIDAVVAGSWEAVDNAVTLTV